MRHLVYAAYMVVCIPVEILLIIPLEIKHRLLINNMPSYRAFKGS
jgi:hypothetical protein